MQFCKKSPKLSKFSKNYRTEKIFGNCHFYKKYLYLRSRIRNTLFSSYLTNEPQRQECLCLASLRMVPISYRNLLVMFVSYEEKEVL
jgi:hypothetical protein